MGIVWGARALGIKVPEELSIVGFADLRAASRVRPQLTTIAQYPVEMGRLAATRLLTLLTAEKTWDAATENPPFLSRVPVRMIVRQSTGPAPESSR